MDIADFEVVAENRIVADLQRRDARPFGLAPLNLKKIVLAVAGDAAQFVEFRVHSGGNHVALAEHCGRVRVNRPLKFFRQGVAAVEIFREGLERSASGGLAKFLDRLDSAESPADHQHAPRLDLPGRSPRTDSFKVTDVADERSERVETFRVLREPFHDVVPPFQLFEIRNRQSEPVAQKPRAHRAGCVIHDINQACPVFPGGAPEDFEVAAGELVHPHELLPVDAGDGADVVESVVTGLFEINQQRTRSGHPEREPVHREALERIDFQLFLQFFNRVVIDERPLLKRGDIVLPARLFPDLLFAALRDEEFLGTEGVEQVQDIVFRPFRDLECAGGHIQKRDSAFVPSEAQTGYEVVLFLVEQLLVESHAGGHDLGYPPLDDVLGEFRVFQLVADGHLVTRTHKTGEIGVDGMVGETGHRDGIRRRV